jgi:hypothetical protein
LTIRFPNNGHIVALVESFFSTLYCSLNPVLAQAGSNGCLDIDFDFDFNSDLLLLGFHRNRTPTSSSKRARGLHRGLESSGNDTGSSIRFSSSSWRRIVFTFDNYFHISTIRQEQDKTTISQRFSTKTTSTDRVPEVLGVLFPRCTVWSTENANYLIAGPGPCLLLLAIGPYGLITEQSNRRPPAPAFYYC